MFYPEYPVVRPVVRPIEVIYFINRLLNR